MLHADWLHELLLGCILAKSARNISKVLAAEKHLSITIKVPQRKEIFR